MKTPKEDLFILFYPRMNILKWKNLSLVFVVLIVQNLIFFYPHYFKGHGFPYDFTMSYFAIPFYANVLAKLGISSDWMPFQASGYPLALNPQTRLLFLPILLINIFKITFTVKLAVFIQCLTILFGGLGAYYFARRNDIEGKFAILLAVLYQGSGSFFSNAQHVDIVSGYAFLPWFFGAIMFEKKLFSFSKVILLPLVINQLIVACYPGIWISSFFLGGIWMFIQYLELVKKDSSNASYLLKEGAVLFVFALLGLASAVYHLAPLIIYKDLNVKSLHKGMTFFYLKSFETLILTPLKGGWSGLIDISMRTIYITIFPVLSFFLYFHKKLSDYVVIIFALMIATGGIFYHSLVKLFSPIGFSRFPFSDYRQIIVLFILLISVANFQRLVLAFDRKRFFISLGVLAFYLLFITYGNLDYIKGHWRSISLQVLMVVPFALLYSEKFRQHLVYLVILISILLQSHMLNLFGALWKPDNITKVIENGFGGDQKSLRKKIKDKVLKTKGSRPTRDIFDQETPYVIRGYTRGAYFASDYSGGRKLKPIDLIYQNKDYLEFISQPSGFRLYNLVNLDNFHNSVDVKNNQFDSTLHGLDKNRYLVSLDKDYIVVENETYYDGWIGKLSGMKGSSAGQVEEVEIKAERCFEAFRCWNLPPGEYTFITSFKFPKIGFYKMISQISLVIWIIGGIVLMLSKRHREL